MPYGELLAFLGRTHSGVHVCSKDLLPCAADYT